MPPRLHPPRISLPRGPQFRLPAARPYTTSAPPARAPPSVDSARTYCSNLLHTHDYPSHLLTAFIPPRARDAHLAIRAFNVDIARIEEQVSSVTVGRMRMQFWRDAVEKTFSGRPPAEPVAVLLEKVLREDAGLSLGFFRKVIAMREQYLGHVPFATLSALEDYAEGTYSSLSYLTLESLHRRSLPLDHIASHLGKSTGITAILRGLPILAESGAMTFPLDIAADVGLRQEDVLRHGAAAEGLREAVFRVATRANDHVITARRMLEEAGEEGRRVFAAFVQVVPTVVYLERLERVDFDPWDRSLRGRAWTLPWRAWRAWEGRRF